MLQDRGPDHTVKRQPCSHALFSPSEESDQVRSMREKSFARRLDIVFPLLVPSLAVSGHFISIAQQDEKI